MVQRSGTQRLLTVEEESSSGDPAAEPIEDHMSRAEWLADEEVAVTCVKADPSEKNSAVTSGPSLMIDPGLMIDEDKVRSEDPADLKQLWAEWVATMGPEEASRRWLAIFAATDAPRTG